MREQSPTTLRDFLKQRRRWFMGIVRRCRRVVKAGKLTFSLTLQRDIVRMNGDSSGETRPLTTSYFSWTERIVRPAEPRHQPLYAPNYTH